MRKTGRLVVFMRMENKFGRKDRVGKVEGGEQRGNFASLRS